MLGKMFNSYNKLIFFVISENSKQEAHLTFLH